MKRALVLSGGGSRGSYQMGAWAALREMGIAFDCVYGASIGSINAALVAQGDFDLAEAMWDTISVDQVMLDGINLDFSWEAMSEQRKEILPFLARFARNRGADISPLIQSVNRAVSERRVRASGMPMGLVTVHFPSLAAKQLCLDEIPQGRLIDYLMASSACFPAFPMYKIDGESYIDGGYYDNMPVDMAVEDGAEEVVAVDLWEHLSHPQLTARPYITYVRPSRPLGTILCFEKDVLARNRRLGYLDALRAYGRVLGARYSFDPDSVAASRDAAVAFSLSAARLDAYIANRHAVARAISAPPLAEALRKNNRPGRAVSYENDLLRGAEAVAERLSIDPMKIYTVEEMNRAICDAFPREAGSEALEMLRGGDFAGITRLISQADKRLVLSALTALVQSENRSEGALRALALFPEELLAATYMARLLQPLNQP